MSVEFKQQYGNFIGGEFVEPLSGQYMDNVSPVNGRVLCQVARSDQKDIEGALDAAHAAKEAWGKTSLAERGLVLNGIAQVMEDNLALLAEADTWDNGKPIRETTAADLPLAIDHFRYFGGVIRAQEGSIAEIDADTVAYHFHEPLGVVGQIIPWNFPLLMATWKLAPALAAGNCVVLKPAEQTPASIMVLMELISEILPTRCLERGERLRLEAGKPLASSQRVAKVAFTGETTTGRLIMQYASQNIIPVTLELGGKSPNIFFRDVLAADDDFFDKALEGLRDVRAEPGRSVHLPQPCADRRVHLRRVHGPRLAARRGDCSRDPARPGDDGRRAGLERADGEDPLLHRHRQEGRARGARRGRDEPPDGDLADGYYVQPTVLRGDNRMRVFQEEIFGPVVSVTTFKDDEEALSIANDTLYGLGAGVWSRDANRCYRLGAAIKAGACGRTATTPTRPTRPSAATSNRASGARTTKMLDHYQQTKNLLVSYSPQKLGFF